MFNYLHNEYATGIMSFDYEDDLAERVSPSVFTSLVNHTLFIQANAGVLVHCKNYIVRV